MSWDYTETNGARNDSLNMENFAKDCEPFFTSQRTFLNKTEMILDRWMKCLSRWTVAIRHPLANRCLPLMAARSLMNGRMRFHHSCEKRLHLISSVRSPSDGHN